MKVRISGNSIRFRLKEPEVIYFSEEGKIYDTIQFGPGSRQSIQFVLEKSSGEKISVSFENNQVTVAIPFFVSDEWTNTSKVGIEESVQLEGNINLLVLIEKDFACLDGTPEDNEGTYPNPLVNCKTEDVKG